MANVKHLYPLLPFQSTEDHTKDVWLVSVKQVSKLVVLKRDRTTVWHLFQAENRLLESLVPFQRRIGTLGVDLLVQTDEITLGRAAILTRYAMGGLKFVEEVPRRSNLSYSGVLQALTNSFVGIGARGNIGQALMRLGVLRDCCFAPRSKNHGALSPLALIHSAILPVRVGLSLQAPHSPSTRLQPFQTRPRFAPPSRRG